jgi:hypothetical protein
MTEGSASSSLSGTATSAAATPVWVRVAMPSIADLIFAALLGVLVFTSLSVRLLGDAGIGWHIRTGQQILATHEFSRVDPFSASAAEGQEAVAGNPAAERFSKNERLYKKWFAWEWLYDVIVGRLEASLGLNGVVWFTAVVIAAVFAGTFLLLMRRGTNVLVAVVLTLLAISASMIHFLARPHVLSWLFTLAWFVILGSAENYDKGGHSQIGKRWLWVLPLLMLVWVNVHGGFLLGFVLIKIFFLGAVWEWWRARGDRIEEALQRIAAGRRAIRLIWVGLVCALASLVNPYGWKLHAHVYAYLSNRFLMDHIEEFQSPNFHGIAQKCFLALLLITIAIVAARGRKLRMSELLTLLFAVYAGLYASRNIPVSAILLVVIIGPHILPNGFTRGDARGFFHRMAVVEAGMRGHLWPLVAIVATFAIAANGGRVGSNRLMDAHFDARRMPVGAVDYLEAHQIQGVALGPVLSPDYWGGYLIYRHIPVVVDDRHDFYGEDFLKSYLKMMHVEGNWQEFLQTHDAACVLLPRDSALANVLMETQGWKRIYSDDVAVAFVPE